MEDFTGEGGGEVTHSIWRRTMRRFTIFLKLAHKAERGLRAERYQKGDRAARGWNSLYLQFLLFQLGVQGLTCHLSIPGQR